jgi:hypothetical protein
MQVSIDLPNMVSGDVTVLCFPLPNQGRGSFFFLAPLYLRTTYAFRPGGGRASTIHGTRASEGVRAGLGQGDGEQRNVPIGVTARREASDSMAAVPLLKAAGHGCHSILVRYCCCVILHPVA